MDANGFSLTIIVYVSSRSVDMRLPNQERFVSSGEASGVWLNSSAKTEENNHVIFINIRPLFFSSLRLRKLGLRMQIGVQEETFVPKDLGGLFVKKCQWA